MSRVNEILTRGAPADLRRRVLVIVNPVSGRRRHGLFRSVLDALAAAGCAAEVVETAAPGDAKAIVAARAGCGYDAVVVAGGDGTINEAINGLGADAPPLGIIPLGTANVLAIEIGLAVRPDAIAGAIAAGPARGISTGLVNGRRFVQMAGIGFDAHVVETVDLGLKRRIGKAAYVWQSIREGLRYPFPRFEVAIDGIATQASSLIVANGRHYAGSFVSAPEAGLDRPWLDVCVFTRFGLLNALRYGAALTTGRLAGLADVEIRQAHRIDIAGPAEEPVQADGDLVGRLPARIELAPQPLDLIYPRPV